METKGSGLEKRLQVLDAEVAQLTSKLDSENEKLEKAIANKDEEMKAHLKETIADIKARLAEARAERAKLADKLSAPQGGRPFPWLLCASHLLTHSYAPILCFGLNL